MKCKPNKPLHSEILRNTLLKDTQFSETLAESIQKRFAQLDGVDELPVYSREAMRKPPQFEQLVN